MSPKKRWLIGILSVAFCAACAFGWREYQQIQDYRIENLPEGNKANNYGNYTGSMSNHDKVYDNLIEVLTHNAPITTSSYEGMKTVEIIEKIYRAAKN